MIRSTVVKGSKLKINNSNEGERLETKIERVVHNNEPIKDGAPLVYTERSEGVRASTNVKTDRFEVALDATTKIEKSYKAKRENRADVKAKMKAEKGGNSEKKSDTPEGGSSSDSLGEA